MVPSLNWRELARCAEWASKELIGTHLDRIFIAERADFSQGYLKNEWFLRFGDRKREAALALSVRPRACYFTVQKGKGPQPSSVATRSPFDQALSKYLKGRRLTHLRTLERERYLILEFDGSGRDESRESYWLIVALIPALPEAFLVEAGSKQILARSRTVRDSSAEQQIWKWPAEGRSAPELPIREELVPSLEVWRQVVEKALSQEGQKKRAELALREIRDRLKTLRNRLKQSEDELQRARQEPEWGRLGEALKQSLYSLPEPVKGHWWIEGLQIPCGESQSPTLQLEKIFSLERRKKRRIEEASSRANLSRQRIHELERWLDPELDPIAHCSALERAAGIQSSGPRAQASAGGRRAGPSVPSRWTGRTYFSREGLPLLVGRSRDENLELTFKIARGNDLWMHVRGRPGAHLLIPLPSGRSAALETLLDAAQLVIFHSGGKNWGKTEVDYTYKKYVKRIKDSSEASYVQNKTLIVAPEPERLARLLGQEDASD
jgi:predicted ribosome quality control (RQC) complex YloA/Tae2 family protein